jgi:uncharacterized RDD family membrane protein YckC
MRPIGEARDIPGKESGNRRTLDGQTVRTDVEPRIGRLWAATLLDAVLGVGLWALCAEGLLAVWGLPGTLLAQPPAVLPRLLALAVVLHLVYHVLCVGRFGRTLGKGVMGIAVVRRDGSPAGYGRALLRSVGGMVSVLTLGLANLGVLLRRDRRGAGDWLADTRVVRIPRS